jgi:hypothetical protein
MGCWDAAAAATSSCVDINKLALARRDIVEHQQDPWRLLRNVALVGACFAEAGIEYHVYRAPTLVGACIMHAACALQDRPSVQQLQVHNTHAQKLMCDQVFMCCSLSRIRLLQVLGAPETVATRLPQLLESLQSVLGADAAAALVCSNVSLACAYRRPLQKCRAPVVWIARVKLDVVFHR